MTDNDPTDPTEGAATPEETDPDRPDRRLLIALIVLAVVLAGGLLFALANNDDDDVATGDTTSTTEATTTSTTEGSTTSSQVVADAPSAAELDTVVWPGPDTTTRYDTPEAAVRGFAVDFARFADPAVGDFMQGDSRSGEIEISQHEGGPITTVLVRQLSDNTWWILGAVTDFIQLETPEAGDTVTSPLAVSGMSSAFEAAVDVAVFDLGATAPIGEGFVMGSGDADLGPFSGQIAYDSPAGTRGVLLLYTISPEDGSTLEAVAIPVKFGDA